METNLEFAIVASLYMNRRVRVAGPERIALVEKVIEFSTGNVWLKCRYPGEEWSFTVRWQDCTVLDWDLSHGR